jgi:hypothetical protein
MMRWTRRALALDLLGDIPCYLRDCGVGLVPGVGCAVSARWRQRQTPEGRLTMSELKHALLLMAVALSIVIAMEVLFASRCDGHDAGLSASM